MLRRGDFLVVDNCKIHTAERIVVQLSRALDAAGVRMVLLPAYSPEYQPAELVFAMVKSELRKSRSGAAFCAEVMRAFSTVSRNDVIGFYKKCIHDVV